MIDIEARADAYRSRQLNEYLDGSDEPTDLTTEQIVALLRSDDDFLFEIVRAYNKGGLNGDLIRSIETIIDESRDG